MVIEEEELWLMLLEMRSTRNGIDDAGGGGGDGLVTMEKKWRIVAVLS